MVAIGVRQGLETVVFAGGRNVWVLESLYLNTGNCDGPRRSLASNDTNGVLQRENP